jgi:hypothetical protein
LEHSKAASEFPSKVFCEKLPYSSVDAFQDQTP